MLDSATIEILANSPVTAASLWERLVKDDFDVVGELDWATFWAIRLLAGGYLSETTLADDKTCYSKCVLAGATGYAAVRLVLAAHPSYSRRPKVREPLPNELVGAISRLGQLLHDRVVAVASSAIIAFSSPELQRFMHQARVALVEEAMADPDKQETLDTYADVVAADAMMLAAIEVQRYRRGASSPN